MNRLPQSCKKALFQHHSSSHQVWSLNRLIEMGTDFTDQKEVRQETAETLLKDVKLRLAKQHALCLAMKGAIEGTHTNTTGVHESSKMIKASMKTAFAPSKDLLVHTNHSKKLIDDLEAMHADTYRLIWQLYNSSNCNIQPPVIQNFTPVNQSFVCSIFEQIRSRHAHSIDSFAHLIVSQRVVHGNASNYLIDLCTSFLKGRFGIQLLCDHFVGLHKQSMTKSAESFSASKRPKKIGSIDVDCNVWNVIEDAASEASSICDTNLSVAPDVCVWYDDDMDDNIIHVKEGSNITLLGDGELSAPPVTLVKSWVHHCLVEVFKNAMQASVRNDASASSPVLVNVRKQKYKNANYLQVSIRDHGVGLSNDGIIKAM